MREQIFQLTKEEALRIYESREWENWSDEEIARFQLYQDRLCVEFSRFHKSMEVVLDRPVWTHEFAFKDRLIAEYEKRAPKPTMADIINLIPKDKRIVILAEREPSPPVDGGNQQ